MDLGFINPSINLSHDREEELVFVHHFINSTVHTSRMIWALKTVKKLIYAFTERKQRSYVEQQLPPAAESGGAPARGWRLLLKAEHRPPRWPSHISRPYKAQKTDRYKQYCTIFAFRDQQIHTSTAEFSSEKGRTYGTVHRITHTSKQNPLEQNTCTGMQAEVNQPFFFNVTNIIQGVFFFRVTVSEHKLVSCTKITMNNTMSHCPQQNIGLLWGLGNFSPSLTQDSIIQDVSQGN